MLHVGQYMEELVTIVEQVTAILAVARHMLVQVLRHVCWMLTAMQNMDQVMSAGIVEHIVVVQVAAMSLQILYLYQLIRYVQAMHQRMAVQHVPVNVSHKQKHIKQ